MNEELKQNRCGIFFDCNFVGCCFFTENKDDQDNPYCKYMDEDTGCGSSVARVNAMVLEMKRLGFVPIEEIYKNILTEVQGLLKQSLDSGTGLKPVELAYDKIEGFLKGE